MKKQCHRDVELRKTFVNQRMMFVRCVGKYKTYFHDGKIMLAIARASKNSGLPFPLPKHKWSSFYVKGNDGESFPVENHLGLRSGFVTATLEDYLLQEGEE